MKVAYHKEFEKNFAKLSTKKKAQVKAAVAAFIDDPYNPKLRNHPSKGDLPHSDQSL